MRRRKMIGTRRKMLRSEKGMPEECDNCYQNAVTLFVRLEKENGTRLGSKRNEIMKMLTYF
jgi:hypothetical protein